MQYIGDRDRLRVELAVLNAAEAAKEDAPLTAPRDSLAWPQEAGLVVRPMGVGECSTQAMDFWFPGLVQELPHAAQERVRLEIIGL